MANEIDYIKIQWDDIHHTRNQDWKIIALMLADFYALFNSEPENFQLQSVLTICGLILGIIGISITVTHWKNFYYKIKVIEKYEAKIDIVGDFYKPRFPVQAHILATYIFIVCSLMGWALWLVLNNISISFTASFVLFMIGLILCFYLSKYLRKTILS